MIGVLGGTFDPVHFGHLRPALEVCQALGLRELRLVPLRCAVHRPQPLASPEQRLAMLRAAVAGEPGLTIDDRELRRPGPSYTFDTLRELRAEQGPKQGLCLLLGADAFRGFLSWQRPEGILDLAHLVVMRRPALARRARAEGTRPEGVGVPPEVLLSEEVLVGEGRGVETAGGMPRVGQTLRGRARRRAALAEMDQALANWSRPRLCALAGELATAPAGRIWFQEVTQLEISATRIRQLLAQGRSPRFLLPDAVLDYILAAGLYRLAPGSPASESLGPSSLARASCDPAFLGLASQGQEAPGT